MTRAQEKVEKVIASCLTLDHLRGALNMIFAFEDFYRVSCRSLHDHWEGRRMVLEMRGMR